jgi:hypothetical protein
MIPDATPPELLRAAPCSPSDFVFGKTRVRGIWAGEQNPIRDGIFVEIKRVTGRLNPGTWLRLTDGNGKFWEFEMRAVVIWQPDDTFETVAKKAQAMCEIEQRRRGWVGKANNSI